MPKRSSSGGSVADAFGAQFGAVRGSVKMTYMGKDKFGNSIYKFSYQVPKTVGAYSRSKSAQSNTVSSTRTFAVNRSEGGGWHFAAPGSAKANPNVIANPEDTQLTVTSGARQDLINRAIAKVTDLINRGLITPEQGKTLTAGFADWGDTALRMWISRAGTGNRPGASVIEVEPEGSAEDLLTDVFTGGFGGGGGGGGGGGLGPVYRAPDRRVVEDYVKGSLVSLVGNVPDYLVGPGVEAYMKDHRRNFDSETQEIDPQMSVIELIRNSREYQAIHKLRPKSVDEREWISQRAAQAQQGGLDTAKIEQFAIDQATIGADVGDVAEAAAFTQFNQSGQAPTLLDNKFRQVVTQMFQGVGR